MIIREKRLCIHVFYTLFEKDWIDFFQKSAFYQKTQSLNELTVFNEWSLIIRSGCGGLTVMERLITIEVDLLGFKHTAHKLYYNSILARSRFKYSAVTKRSVGDLMVTLSAIILLSRPDHISAVKIINNCPRTLL